MLQGPTTVTYLADDVREAGFVTGSVVDPFGNVLGLMHGPHWSGESA